MKIIAALSIAAIVANTATAGVYVESVRHDRVTGAVQSDDKIYVQNGQARMDNGRNGGYTLFKDDGVYQVNPTDQTYRVMDKAAMDQVSAKMSDAMARMKAQMANMPPERRAMMEKMMSQMNGQAPGAAVKPAVYDAVDTGQTESSNGRSCRVWNVTRNGELSEQYCVAPKGSLPGAEEFIVFAKKMSAFFERMTGPMHAMSSGIMQSRMAVIEKINGFPIITRRFSGGKLENEETVVKTWESRSMPAAQFEVPAGYTRKDFMDHGH